MTNKTKTKNVKILECLRCGHEWMPRKKKTPKMCPKCNSPYWNRRRQKEVKKDLLTNFKFY